MARLVLACVLPMALAAAGLIYHVYSTERAALTSNALNRTRAFAFALDREIAAATVPSTPAHMAAFLAAQNLPPSWRAAIIGPEALVEARSHDARTFIGKPIRPDLKARMLQAPEGAYESVALDGVPVMTLYSQAPVSRRTVAVGIPLAELTASLYGGIAWLALCTAGAAAAGLLLAAAMARRIGASITALIAPAAALGQEGVLALPTLHFAETRILGAALSAAHLALAAMRGGLRASEQRLNLATQATGVGIWVRNLEHRDIWASAEWRALFGFTPFETVTMDQVIARIHPDDRAGARTTLLGVAQSGGGYDIEYRLALPDGSQCWVASRGRIGSDGTAGSAVILGISSNISARKVAELALQKKQEEVFHLSRVGIAGELSGALAHEISQPLTSILGNAQAAQRLLERTPPPLDELRAILADIVAENRHAAEVIRRLRGLLRNSTSVQEAIDFDAMTGDVAGLLRNDLLNRAIQVDTMVGAGLPGVLGDRVQLQQVLINLIVNACDAIGAQHDTPDARPRKILVAVAPAVQRAGIDLTVHDSGPGLAAGQCEAVFEPFHSTKPDGMGLGLSICRKIVHAHGGRIQASNHPRGGAVFHVFLPAAHG